MVLADLLRETAIAPVVFRQHQVSDTFWDEHTSHCTHTNPDGPSCILLFDVQNSANFKSLGNLSTIFNAGISNPICFPYSSIGSPYSLFNPFFDSMHMGKHDVIYCGISSHTFFPHAKLSSLGVVSTVSQFEEQNTEQEVVTRAYNIRRRPSSPHGPGQDLLIPPTRVHKNDSSEGPSSYHESTSSIIWPLTPPPNRYILSSFLVIQPGW